MKMPLQPFIKKFNDISYETSKPILMKFHINSYVIGIQNFEKKSHDSKFKMAAMPIYGKKTFKRLRLQNH